MEFKYINDKNKTPNRSTANCDSSFKVLPIFSTPPSRCAKIINPFESHHVIEQLHLPTFSPSVFATVSTPNTDKKFKWTIEDISSLKPADIDEGTISQHVFEEDPHIESLVQQKIDKFFSEKVIVPSPMTEVVRVPLINTINPMAELLKPEEPKKYYEGSTQTILTLPPKLPEALENLLKPYFTYTVDQQKTDVDEFKDSSLYRNLFDFDHEVATPGRDSIHSSPALSTGLSPIEFSPLRAQLDTRDSIACDIPVLRECNLSPIYRKSSKDCRPACRLDFSTRMNVDASMVVPDIANHMSSQSVYIDENSPPPAELLSDSTVNWDMEYKHVSLASPCASPDVDKMDISNSNTPHSRIFTSQRKRLSESFKDEINDFDKENQPQIVDNVRQIRKLFKNDITDAGYHTESITFYEESFRSHVFASTPSKRQNK